MNLSLRYVLFTLFSLTVMYGVYYITFSVVLPRIEFIPNARSVVNERTGIRRYGLSTIQTRRMFDPRYTRSNAISLASMPGSGQVTAMSDTIADSSLDGVLVPVSCTVYRRPCLTDRDCKTLCTGKLDYVCDSKQNVCSEPRVIDIEEGLQLNDPSSSSSPSSSIKCRTEKGEYAVLQGYNDLGTAKWECVQLFPGWEGGGTKYCENGIVDIDTRVRLPSYKDCTCPQGTTRIVYALSRLGQQVYGLPHCVKDTKLYNLGTDFLAL